MSRTQFESEKKSLDYFFWVNEITGEATHPPGERTAPAASGEKRGKKSGCQRRSAHRPQATDALRPASPAHPEAAQKDPGSGSFLCSTLVPRAAARTWVPVPSVACVHSPPGDALKGPFRPPSRMSGLGTNRFSF
uniref:Uncharacterized protein n=1 Tax=Nannospalax galili TaxID=1026970 RepID=A0A8C6RAJ4_NANGA